MKRVQEYLGFAVWFVGIGYVVLWPLASSADGTPFGGSFVCGTGALAVLCDFEHPLTLPLGLHVLGALSAMAMIGQLSCRTLRRLRWPAGFNAVASGPRPPAAIDRLSGRSTLRVARRIKPRSEFGLRRTPR